MTEPEIIMIMARCTDGTIGDNGSIPWHVKEDMERFKELTMGYPVIMGRKTYESIPGPLKGRKNIVLSRDRNWNDGVNCDVAYSPAGALYANSNKFFVIGGAEIYKLFEPLATEIELTEIHSDYEGDVKYPPFGPEWEEVSRTNTINLDPNYSFVTLKRKG